MKFSEFKTTLIVTHKLETIKNVDKICVVKNGEIVGVGTHNELFENNATYQDFFKNKLI